MKNQLWISIVNNDNSLKVIEIFNEYKHLSFILTLIFLVLMGLVLKLTDMLKILMFVELTIACIIYAFATLYVHETGATSIYSAIYALLLITLGAAEAAIAIAIVIINYRHQRTLSIDEFECLSI